MIISTVIRTFRREVLLERAVKSVLAQELPDAELQVTVVNDAGEPLGKADWQSDERVTVVTTHRTRLCVAGNTGAALSRGEYLHFLDDDDALLPGAYASLLKVARKSDADWIYGGYEGVDDDGHLLFTVMPSIYGEVFADLVADARIPLGCALIRRDAFFAVGGLDSSVIPAEDSDLLQLIALRGQLEACEALVARFRVSSEGTTTQWSAARAASQRKREKVFLLPECLPAIRRTARDQRTRGLVVRFYLSSAIRNARRAPLTAISRAAVAAQLSLPGLVSPKFWRALKGVKQ